MTFTNTVYALITRVLAAPTVPIPSVVDDDISWMPTDKLVYRPEIHEQEYKENLKPHQRQRILSALEEYKKTNHLPGSVDVFPKCDELLLRKSKPRIIWNVPPIYQGLLGPVVRQTTFLLKSIYDGKRVYSLNGIKFTLQFACGMVAEDLDLWMNYNMESVKNKVINWAGIFLGDDTYILHRDNDGKVVCTECDYSAYDSTQRTALQQLTLKYYRSFGIDGRFLDLFWRVANLKLRVKYGKQKQFSFKVGLDEPQTATGKPDTCNANTINNIHVTVKYMCENVPHSAFGLVAKLKSHTSVGFGTFLKGFWNLDSAGFYRWNYLPGSIIKLMKTFNYVPLRDGTLTECFKRNFYSIGMCSAPLYRIFVKRWNLPTRVLKQQDFKILRDSYHELNALALDQFLEYRYSANGKRLIYSMETILSTAEVGADLYNPVWELLACVDYGDGIPNGKKN